MSQPELIPPFLTPNPVSVTGAGHPLAPAAISDAAKVLGTAATSPQAPQPSSKSPQRIPRWLERAELFLRVVLRMYIGLAVCYAPWSHMFWDQNPLFLQFPTLSIYAANGAVRGIVSGLGLLNLWIAFQDALSQRDK
jgi:hypothetical protein